MTQRLLHALYERLGARYPLTILVAAMSVQYFALLLGVSVLALYLDVSIGQFL